MVLKARVDGKSSYVTEHTLYGTLRGDHGRTIGLHEGAQYVSSEGHDYRNLGKSADVGGPFVSQRIETSRGPAEPFVLTDGAERVYTCLYPSSTARNSCQSLYSFQGAEAIAQEIGRTSPGLISDFDLDGLGATAISRVKPTNPVFDGSTFLAELISERKLFAIPGRNGGVSGEYLNYQLGAAPAYGAFNDFRKAAENSEKLLEQLHRDSGRNVRRRYEFPTDPESVQESVSSGVYPIGDVALNLYLVKAGTLTTRTWTSQKIWFSGAFTYYVPKDVGLRRRIAELEHLYGVKPGIDTAWELIPFSFVADYFANIGDVVSNLNSFAQDGLVMRYGYMMAETVRHTNQIWTGTVRKDGAWQTISLAWTRVETNKQRRAANPFGFGVLQEDLTSKQLSILAALGMSRR